MADEVQYCTFYLEKLFFGIPVMNVQEVLRYQEMTKVPLAHQVVKGLINLRGQIVTAIDLRSRLDLPDRDRDKLPMNIVVRTDSGTVSLLVDEIGDVIETDPDNFERVPDTLDGVARELVSGVYKLQKRLLLILDTEKTLDLSITGTSR